MNITITDHPDRYGELHAQALDWLDAFNREVGIERGKREIALEARDEKGELAGVLTGEVAWTWLEVKRLAVRPGRRKSGIGSQLLAHAEALARRQNLRGLVLHTLSFQAPEFYRSHGFVELGCLPDSPAGHRRIYFYKLLA